MIVREPQPTTSLKCLTVARIPAAGVEFRLHLYRSESDGKDHLALVLGEVARREGVMVRIHSECFTGDVLGSARCDCGAQLERSLRLVAAEGTGVLLYLRQEGRGIGLLQKLRAYNLQDAGYDTVEANLELGHQADERDYHPAAAILRDLEIPSIRLLTNNPSKVEGLAVHGYTAVERVPLLVEPTSENAGYLETKVRRMKHLLGLDLVSHPLSGHVPEALRDASLAPVADGPWSPVGRPRAGRPWVTLAYAQSLDGSITLERGKPMNLSSREALVLTHRLRSQHDAILVGIGTVLADDPRLNVRLVDGKDPQPVVLDSRLRTPVDSQLVTGDGPPPWIATVAGAEVRRRSRLEGRGARVLEGPRDDEGRVDLGALLAELGRRGVRSLMVEGGARVLTSFLRAGAVDRLVVTIAPVLVGGLSAVERLLGTSSFPRLLRPQMRWVGGDLVLMGDVSAEQEELAVDEDLVGLSGGML